TSALLNAPYGIAVDNNTGDVFITDQGNHVIDEVDDGGTISVIAGNGTPGDTGDGGPASAALLSAPAGIFVDPSGNLFFADEHNFAIRKIATSGTITTVAGTIGVAGTNGGAN